MKPVLNSTETATPGSRWFPLEGGPHFSTSLGLVIVDENVGARIHYHYERYNADFSQFTEDFYQFAWRVG